MKTSMMLQLLNVFIKLLMKTLNKTFFDLILVIVNAIYSDIIIENCNDQEEEQLESFGDARPAEHRPFHRRKDGHQTYLKRFG